MVSREPCMAVDRGFNVLQLTHALQSDLPRMRTMIGIKDAAVLARPTNTTDSCLLIPHHESLSSECHEQTKQTNKHHTTPHHTTPQNKNHTNGAVTWVAVIPSSNLGATPNNSASRTARSLAGVGRVVVVCAHVCRDGLWAMGS